MTTPRRMVAAGLALLLIARLAPAMPEVFQKLTFEKAKERAIEEKKLLLVDATAEWCGPCKIMDKTTWVDQKVVEWLNTNTLAIQIDVDELPELSEQLRIRAMPTVIVFRDGAEFDRAVGLQEPEPLLEWLDGVKAGRSALQSLQADVQADPANVEKRFELAKQLLDTGAYEPATEHYVWLWDNKQRHSRAMGGTIGFFIARGSQQLVEEHEPSKQAFVRVRDAVEARLNEHKGRDFDRADWVELNEIVGDDDRTLAWFDRVKNNPTKRQEIEQATYKLEQLLEEKERWADRGKLIGDADAFVGRIIMMQRMTETHAARAEEAEVPSELAAWELQRFREDIAKAYASLLAAGRTNDAARVVHAANRYKPDGKVLVEVVEWALYVNKPLPVHLEWLETAGKKGQDVGDLKDRVGTALVAQDVDQGENE